MLETNLNGKTAVITAGANGLGLVVAKTLRTAGAEVFVCDIDQEAISNLPSDLHGSVVDVSNPNAIDTWLDEIGVDRINILVNNAGISGPAAAIEDISTEEWQKCLQINLDAMFFTSRRVAGPMKDAGEGVIINMSSTAGFLGMPLRAPYVAAKFAVVGLTKTLAMELGPHGIRVNAIAPGSINGPRMDRVIAAHAEADGLDEDYIRRMYTRGVSMGRFQDPDEIADLILYLTSAHARSINGQLLSVDGHTETLYPRDL